MYDYIIGNINSHSKESITVEVNGIGYKIFTTTATIAHVLDRSELTKFYISFIVREFSHSLYGFLTRSERDLFEGLLNISGIGPKIALAMIGNILPEQLFKAVAEKDMATLCKIPGIGKKTAERLLIELKDIVTTFPCQETSSSTDPIGKDAVSALINLGYSQMTAQKAVKQAVSKHTCETDLSRIIALALQEVS